ncbi:MAG: hypothetical protein V1781_04610 [Bacteroidota bacterium]
MQYKINLVGKLALGLKELWERFRKLLCFFLWRDIKLYFEKKVRNFSYPQVIRKNRIANI